MAQKTRTITDIVRPHKKPFYAKTFFYRSSAVALLLLISLFVGWQWSQSDLRTVNKDTYQAVTLSNNQLYFGKITSMTTDTITLKNVYYLSTPSTSGSQNNTTTNTNTLRPLTKVVYGPEDILYLHKDQVISWQNLSKDSQVVKSIDAQ